MVQCVKASKGRGGNVYDLMGKFSTDENYFSKESIRTARKKNKAKHGNRDEDVFSRYISKLHRAEEIIGELEYGPVEMINLKHKEKKIKGVKSTTKYLRAVGQC